MVIIGGSVFHQIFPVEISPNICRVLTMVIFGGSVLHHALNAPHYLYSYAPHRPTSLSRCYNVIIICGVGWGVLNLIF